MNEEFGLDFEELETETEGKTRVCYVDPVVKCAILGVSQVMSQIEDAAVLVHGPKGCAFPAYEATLYDKLVFNFSEMCEKAVVFGGENIVKEKIYDTYHDNMPSIISVITTCSSEIIGDDINGVIDSIEDIPIPIFRTEGVGFKRDNWESIDHALTELVKLKATGVKRRDIVPDGTINLICPVGTSMRWKDDVLSLENQLEALGQPIRRLVCQNNLSDLDNAHNASLNVVINPDVGMETAQFMKQRFNIPYIASTVPIGIENTVNWFSEIAQFFDIDVAEKLEMRAKKVRIDFRKGLGRVTTCRPMEFLQRVNAVIIGEPRVAKAYLHFLTRELELSVSHVVLKTQEYHDIDMSKLFREYSGIQFHEISDNMKMKDLFEEIKPDLLLGNDFEYLLCRPICNPIYLNITYTGARRLKMTPRPHMGFDGVLNIAEDLINSIIDRYT